MTQKQFWNDPYLTALETKVTWVQSDCIRLQETIFFAFSGGQESDAGTIGGHPVLEARKSGLEIDYRLADARVPCGGTHVRRTAEVGKLSLKRKNIGKGKERIEIHVPQ
ncbi:MAG: hypothetical protein QF512_08835 [Alphaproteobacteria bacterium]|nr:hypothetical protein [Alphaproteobacteria bacterium]